MQESQIPDTRSNLPPVASSEGHELIELLARQMPMVLAAVVVVAPTAFYIHNLRMGSSEWVERWLALALVLGAIRAALVVAYWQFRTASTLALWRWIFALGSLASGSLFGAFGWMAAQTGDGQLMVFTIMMVVGLTAGSVASLSADRLVYGAFAVSAMGPVIVRFLLAPDEPNRAMGVLGIVFLVTHLGYSILQNRTMRDLIRLRNQEKALARDLEEARDRAERSNAEKTRFLLAAGHDLRQPLYAIRLLLDSLDVGDSATRASRVATIGESVNAISDLLERMLEAARAGSKGYVPQLGPVELEGVLRQIGVEFAVDAYSKELDLCFVGTKLWAWTDPALLTQILRNFVGNAVRYTESGRVLVGVRRQGRNLQLQVWDTGPGIEAEDIPKVFEPFHQLANPGRQYGGGHGLGLTIARGMADIIGGDITVSSWPGKGSMFAISIPYADVPALAPELEFLPSHSASADGKAFSGRKLLLIEDHGPVREILSELFASWGFEVEAVADAAQALATIETTGRGPDILVSDFRLPGGMDGLAAIRRLRAMIGQPIPALLVTADPAAPSPGEGIHVLLKPVGALRLRRALDEAICLSISGTAPATP
ncbi:MAG: hypothetical protein CFE31_08165 [Rhizobiales bacterium PAR1]|nr:MAG: hypothetical protein CFE31_08165 [Rhizobiales bacterium PAR1]